jgi:hypothetical protein
MRRCDTRKLQNPQVAIVKIIDKQVALSVKMRLMFHRDVSAPATGCRSAALANIIFK